MTLIAGRPRASRRLTREDAPPVTPPPVATALSEAPAPPAPATPPPPRPPPKPAPPAPAGKPKVKAKPKRRRSSGSKLFAHDRRLGVRWVAGADEAGRGSLAGPLVAAAVLFDLDAITPREVRLLSALNDSKQHNPEAREELYPVVMRLASRVHIVSR